MRAQHRRGSFRLDNPVATFLHFPPLFALRRRVRVQRDFINFWNARRPQPDESIPASGQDTLPVRARRHICHGCLMQVQRRERRGGRPSPVER